MNGSPPRAIVVGAGIGGTATSLLLASAGLRTTLVEKNRTLGGSCSAYEKRGFKIDIGTHMFSRGPVGPLGEVLRRCGSPGAIEFRRTRDIADLRSVVEGNLVRVAVPAELRRFPRFIVELARALRLGPLEATQAARMFARILTMSDAELETWNDHTVEEFIVPYFDGLGGLPLGRGRGAGGFPVISLFGYLLGLYFILPYWEVSAGEAFWAFRRMLFDNWLSYPAGGASEIPATYARLAEARGAEVRTGAGVRRILVEGGQVRGVELEDGTVLEAGIVVSTSSLRTTVSRLVGEAHFPAGYVERALRLRGSYVAVQAKIALDRPLVDAGALVGAVGEGAGLLELSSAELKEMFRAVTRGEVPRVMPFYCPVPTNFDRSLAPPGCQLLTLCAVAPTTDVTLTDPGAAWEEAMLRAIRRVVPGLDRHVLFVDRFSVGFLEHWIGKEFGPAVSTAQTPDQVGRRRPPVYTPIRGLYVAGCAAGGRGVGTELAAASAMECADRVLTDLGVPAPGVARSEVALPENAVRAALRLRSWATRAARRVS